MTIYSLINNSGDDGWLKANRFLSKVLDEDKSEVERGMYALLLEEYYNQKLKESK